MQQHCSWSVYLVTLELAPFGDEGVLELAPFGDKGLLTPPGDEGVLESKAMTSSLWRKLDTRTYKYKGMN